MKILGHIHTLNDADVIDRSLQALLNQTYPLPEILLVDNGSTDGTLSRSFPKHVTVIRHTENRGTSGAVLTGFQYALDKGYDWIWIFDADSAPHTDALQKLLHLYKRLPPKVQDKTRILASLPVDSTNQRPYHGVVFDSRGVHPVTPKPGETYYEFDGAMWTGCLFKVQALRRIGLLSPDYVLDWGEYEYGYRGKKCGLKALMHLSSIVDHNIGGKPSMSFTSYRFGPFSFRMFELPPIRCYYIVRNTIYFWMYEYEFRNIFTLFPNFLRVTFFMLNFLVRPNSHRQEVIACLRGSWDGLWKNMHCRY